MLAINLELMVEIISEVFKLGLQRLDDFLLQRLGFPLVIQSGMTVLVL